nr:DUF4230 domain-containing protein [uncultured Prevotella sp.]
MKIKETHRAVIDNKERKGRNFGKGCLSRIFLIKYIVLLFILFIICFVGGVFFWLNSSNEVSVSTDSKIDITPTRIQEIQDIGQWEFLSINDEELIDTVSRGFFSDSELVRIYYGTLRLGVDLHHTEPHWIRVVNDSIIVAKLPAIELLDNNFIDEAKSRSFFEKGEWTSADREQLYQRAYKKMMARCMTNENILIAERNAKQQFTQFLKAMGYKNIKVDITARKVSR